MGMYSYIDWEDIEVKDFYGLKRYKKLLKDSGFTTYSNALKLDEENKTVTLEINGWKIIGYWYYSFIRWLDGLANFIEGEIILDYETHEMRAKLEFKNKQCIIHYGEMVWNMADADEWAKEDEEKKKEDYISKDFFSREKEQKKKFDKIMNDKTLKNLILMSSL